MNSPKRNVLVAQSGGPSPVINASLEGVAEGCRDFPDHVGGVFAAWHGVEGILQEQLVDMGSEPRDEIALLRFTPASGAIGSCRYKLGEEQQEDFERIVDVVRAHDIGYFFYIGGNDSMGNGVKKGQSPIYNVSAPRICCQSRHGAVCGTLRLSVHRAQSQSVPDSVTHPLARAATPP